MERKTFVLIGVMLTLGIINLQATNASAETIRALYSLRYLNLNVGEIATVTDVVASGYRTVLDARVTGLATVASGFKTNMASSGVIRDGSVLPSAFSATEASGSGEDHKLRILLDSGNVTSVDITPPFDTAPGAVPITEAHKISVVDPTSALILPVPGVEPTVGPAACERTLRIFSGIVRFDLRFAFVKTEEIIGNAYKGSVSVCSVRFVPIAGYKPSASMIHFMAANQQIEVRLAPVKGSRLVVLAALNIPLQIGTAALDLERLDVVEASPLRPPARALVSQRNEH